MKSMFHKPIRRLYWDDDAQQWKKGTFIAGGLQADGHLAYDRLDDEGDVIEGEETCYYQIRTCVGLVMYHI